MIAALALDAVVVAVVFGCIWRAGKKGFVRTVVQMVAYLTVMAVALAVSRAAAPVIYNNVVEPILLERYLGVAEGSKIKQNASPPVQKDNAKLVRIGGGDLRRAAFSPWRLPAEKQTSPTDEPAEQESERDAEESFFADQAAEETVRAVLDEIERTLSEKGAGFSALLRESLAQVNLRELAQELVRSQGQNLSPVVDEWISPEARLALLRGIADQTIRPTVTGVIQVLCFALVSAVLMLFVNLLLGMLGVIKYLPLIGRINSFLGGVIGFAQGMLLVWVLALLLGSLLQLTSGEFWIFSETAVQKSWLFHYFSDVGIPRITSLFS